MFLLLFHLLRFCERLKMVDFVRLFKFLWDFWKKQRARLRMQKKSSTFAQSM